MSVHCTFLVLLEGHPPPPLLPTMSTAEMMVAGHTFFVFLTFSRGKLEKNLEQIPYQNIFVPRSCIWFGLATQNLFTLDIHRRIFRRVKSKMADYLTEIT